MPHRALIALPLLAAVMAGAWYLRRDGGERFYTGFVEGEERVIRAEVSGRVLEVRFAEGDAVPADAIIAVLDDQGIRTQVAAKQQEVAMLEAEIRRQEEQVVLTERTWEQDVNARRAELRQATAAATLAEQTFGRERELVSTGASTAQQLDEARAQRDQATSGRDRARDMLARTEAEGGSIEVARRQLEVQRQRRGLTQAQLAELEVTRGKHVIHAPAVATTVQTQFLWPGELAQPGTAVLALLDPRDKYVQIYVPVADVAALHVGRRVAIELDSAPGRRVAGEVSFLSDQANFTPEKIETLSDRMGQVYRAKVRILEDVERFQPGTEGNVFLVDGDQTPAKEPRTAP